MKEKGITINETMTTPTRPGKNPRPVWEVSTLTHQYDQIIRDAGGRRWRGKWSFWDDPTRELGELIEEDNGHTYSEYMESEKERAAARSEKMTDRAAKAQTKSETEYQRSNNATSGIPLGQPILVGHHSERGHRRALEKSDNAMRNSIEEHDKAEHYERRAKIAEKKASGDHSVAFISRRIEEAKTQIRSYDRLIQEAKTVNNQTWLKRLELLKEEQQEKLTYWEQELSNAGGIQYSPENINKGDMINYRKYGWYEVIRVNKKTVTIKGWLGVDSMTWKAPYAEITGHKKAPVEA